MDDCPSFLLWANHLEGRWVTARSLPTFPSLAWIQNCSLFASSFRWSCCLFFVLISLLGLFLCSPHCLICITRFLFSKIFKLSSSNYVWHLLWAVFLEHFWSTLIFLSWYLCMFSHSSWGYNWCPSSTIYNTNFTKWHLRQISSDSFRLAHPAPNIRSTLLLHLRFHQNQIQIAAENKFQLFAHIFIGHVLNIIGHRSRQHCQKRSFDDSLCLQCW